MFLFLKQASQSELSLNFVISESKSFHDFAQSLSLSSKSKLNSVKWRKIKKTWTRPIHCFGIRIHVSFMLEAKRSDFKIQEVIHREKL